MEIEVGEYVRNEDGYIWQIKETKYLDNIFIDEDGKVKEIAGETVFGDDVIVEITKHSKKIVDLIEVGDYVNGHLIIKKGIDGDLIIDNGGYQSLFPIDIKSIVTHEQFESIEYKIEEDK